MAYFFFFPFSFSFFFSFHSSCTLLMGSGCRKSQGAWPGSAGSGWVTRFDHPARALATRQVQSSRCRLRRRRRSRRGEKSRVEKRATHFFVVGSDERKKRASEHFLWTANGGANDGWIKYVDGGKKVKFGRWVSEGDGNNKTFVSRWPAGERRKKTFYSSCWKILLFAAPWGRTLWMHSVRRGRVPKLTCDPKLLELLDAQKT